MRRWEPNGPAEFMPALSHGWWKGWRGSNPLTDEFRDRGRGFNVLSVIGYRFERTVREHEAREEYQGDRQHETDPGDAAAQQRLEPRPRQPVDEREQPGEGLHRQDDRDQDDEAAEEVVAQQPGDRAAHRQSPESRASCLSEKPWRLPIRSWRLKEACMIPRA